MTNLKIMKCPYCDVDMFRINLSIRPDWECPKCKRLFEGGLFVSEGKK